jgi:hypothetical protein
VKQVYSREYAFWARSRESARESTTYVQGDVVVIPQPGVQVPVTVPTGSRVDTRDAVGLATTGWLSPTTEVRITLPSGAVPSGVQPSTTLPGGTIPTP